MIATLSGTVAEKLAELVVVDVQGVGYGLLVTSEDYGKLGIEQYIKLYVYEHIREQIHELYGFTSLDGKQLFEQLLDVNGVGPKVALSILSLGSADAVRSAIAGGDVKFIQSANGVGKRVAERLVVELKDKVGLSSVDLNATGIMQADNVIMKDEAVAALVALGYTTHDAAQALQAVSKSLPTEQRIREALKTGNR